MAFLDGNDLCVGCGACCTDVHGLKLTEREIERLPAFAPLVTSHNGTFALADWDGPCPYLAPDRRCSVFAQRPADCGAYPMDISSIGMRQPDGTVDVHFRFEAGDCPERIEFIARAVRADDAPVVAWLEEASGATKVVLAQDPAQRRKTKILLTLHALRIAVPVLKLLKKLPERPPAPPT